MKLFFRQRLDKWVREYRNAGYRSAETIGSTLRKAIKTTLDDAEEYLKNGYDVLAFKTAVCLLRSAAEVVYSMYKGQDEVFGYINRALELCEESSDRLMESGNAEGQQTICRYGLLQTGYCREWMFDF